MVGLRSIFSDQISFIVPYGVYVPGEHPVVAYSRGADGRLNPIWRGRAECPPPPGLVPN
jgi:hypothetical protein